MNGCRSILVPIPDLVWPYIVQFDPTHPEYGIDEQGRKCLRLDEHIVPAIKALWDAGIPTFSCCCGHGGSGKQGGAITLPMPCAGTGRATTLSALRDRALHEALAQRDRETEEYERGLAVELDAASTATPTGVTRHPAVLLDVVAHGAVAVVVIDGLVRRACRVVRRYAISHLVHLLSSPHRPAAYVEPVSGAA